MTVTRETEAETDLGQIVDGLQHLFETGAQSELVAMTVNRRASLAAKDPAEVKGRRTDLGGDLHQRQWIPKTLSKEQLDPTG